MRYMLLDTAWPDELDCLFKQAVEVAVRYKDLGSCLEGYGVICLLFTLVHPTDYQLNYSEQKQEYQYRF